MLGDAVEANNEAGVGWFSPNGEILAVQFDEVSESKDNQILEFDNYRIEIFVSSGRVIYRAEEIKGRNRKKWVDMSDKKVVNG
ncbi:MAG: hypothetical protein A2583_11080 [Bdellovibrionales bacterium RIFOXYD1_FULL_53_11]|nr:MAG: hypothetical protein A2583_11080 [Bdellovibrionales bacterium RIFOXYD1_FULL_53_11]